VILQARRKKRNIKIISLAVNFKGTKNFSSILILEIRALYP